MPQIEFFLKKETTLDFEQLKSSLLPYHPDIDTGGETLQDKDSNLGKYPAIELQVYRRKKPFHGRVHPYHALHQSQLHRPDQDLYHNCPGKTSDINLSLPTTSIPKLASPGLAETDLDILIAIRKGVRTYTSHLIAKFFSYHRLSKTYKAFTSSLSHVNIPRNIQEALGNHHWKQAVMEEMLALNKNQTWRIVDLPKGKRTVGCK